MKILIIINGVTGSVGTACLARFSREHDVTIIGLSRRAIHFNVFCEKDYCKDGYLPDSTLICSIGDIASEKDCRSFVEKINKKLYEKIIYIHSVGIYPVELDKVGNIYVSNDEDGDGIDDRVMKLSYNAFWAIIEALKITDLPIRALIVSSISDKFKPLVHKSWWTVIGKVKERMKEEIQKNDKISFFVLNVSSVINPIELITTRPFVFQNTNADIKFWLTPYETAEQIASLVFSKRDGFTEDELFHKADYYEEDYFTDKKFTQRKRNELGI